MDAPLPSVDDVPQVAALDLLAGELPAVVGELDCVAVPLAPQVALQLHLVHDEHLMTGRRGKVNDLRFAGTVVTAYKVTGYKVKSLKRK